MYPLEFCEGIIKRLGGDDAKKITVAEVHELVPVNSNKLKRGINKRHASQICK